VGKWVRKRSSVGSKCKQVMISNGNGDEPAFGQCKRDKCLGNRTDLSPRVRACRGFNSTAPPTSPASQYLKLLEEATGWTSVAGNTKTSPVSAKATTLSPLIANCLMFWGDHNE
jgi:hypothetical protein